MLLMNPIFFFKKMMNIILEHGSNLVQEKWEGNGEES